MPTHDDPFAHLPPDLEPLDPTLDVVFERLFTHPKNEALLRDFLRCALIQACAPHPFLDSRVRENDDARAMHRLVACARVPNGYRHARARGHPGGFRS